MLRSTTDRLSPSGPVSAEHQDRQPGRLLCPVDGSALDSGSAPPVHDNVALRKLGGDMGNLFADFMIMEISGGEIDAPAFASRCAKGVRGVREDMRGDGYSDEAIGVYVDACMARMKDKFSAFRGGLFATSDHKVRN
jgi:hypothetical protein